MQKHKLYTLSYFDFTGCRYDIQMNYINPSLQVKELTKKVPLDFIDKSTTKFENRDHLLSYLNNKYHYSEDILGSNVLITYRKKQKNKDSRTKDLYQMKEELLTLEVAYKNVDLLSRVKVRDDYAKVADEVYIWELLKILRNCNTDEVKYYLSKSKHIPQYLKEELLHYMYRDTNGSTLTDCLTSYRNFRDVTLLTSKVKKLK